MVYNVNVYKFLELFKYYGLVNLWICNLRFGLKQRFAF